MPLVLPQKRPPDFDHQLAEAGFEQALAEAKMCRDVVRAIAASFGRLPRGNEVGRELSKKAEVMAQSLEKIEKGGWNRLGDLGQVRCPGQRSSQRMTASRLSMLQRLQCGCDVEFFCFCYSSYVPFVKAHGHWRFRTAMEKVHVCVLLFMCIHVTCVL